MKGLFTAFEGISVERYADRAVTLLRTQVHPTLNRPYSQCGYAPMIELLRYLDGNDFAVYIVSEGGLYFMRPVTEELYDIPPVRVIGSSVALAFHEIDDGGDVLIQPQLDLLDDGPVKPTSIWNRIGKRPIFAAGNSSGDIAMLQFVNKPPRCAFRLLVLHDDPDREFDYVTGAENSLELARRYGWTIASIKDDWKTVFG